MTGQLHAPSINLLALHNLTLKDSSCDGRLITSGNSSSSEKLSSKITFICNYLGSLSTSGIIMRNNERLSLIGSRKTLNVYHLHSKDLTYIKGIDFFIPDGGSILINLDDTEMTIPALIFKQNHSSLCDKDYSYILWNCTRSASIRLDQVTIPGSILAPKSTIFTNNTTILGQVITASIYGSCTLHLYPFRGTLPEIPFI